MTVKLQCYAYGRGSAWQAICIDFDISVYGRSMEEVKNFLKLAVEMHLSAVAEVSVEDQHRLLNRKTPWYVRAKLAFLASLPWLNGTQSEVFPISVPRLNYA